MCCATKQRFSLNDLLKFILRNRKMTGVFHDWALTRIATELWLQAKRGFLHTIIENDEITGMVIAVPDGEYLRIDQILCTTRTAFKTLRGLCRKVYPGRPLLYSTFGVLKTIPAKKV